MTPCDGDLPGWQRMGRRWESSTAQSLWLSCTLAPLPTFVSLFCLTECNSLCVLSLKWVPRKSSCHYMRSLSGLGVILLIINLSTGNMAQIILLRNKKERNHRLGVRAVQSSCLRLATRCAWYFHFFLPAQSTASLTSASSWMTGYLYPQNDSIFIPREADFSIVLPFWVQYLPLLFITDQEI